MATKIAKPRRISRPRVRAPGVHKGSVVPPAPITPQQRRELEELDKMLAALIRHNRQLRARIDRMARAFTSLGEDQLDTLLKGVRKRINRVRRGKPVAKRRVRAA